MSADRPHPLFRVEGNEVKMYSHDGGFIVSLGTTGDAARVAARAFHQGRRDKALEVKSFLLGD